MSVDEKATPLSDAIHLGNTDIEIGRWEPKTTPVERPAHPGHEHMIGVSFERSVVGYRADGGVIYDNPEMTRALVLCSVCNVTIKTSGGPKPGARCVDCFKGQHPAP